MTPEDEQTPETDTNETQKTQETDTEWLVDENGVRYQIYVVQPNEYLVEIAQAFYSDYSYNDVLRIAEYNDLQNISVLHTGQEIKLPEK